MASGEWHEGDRHRRKWPVVGGDVVEPDPARITEIDVSGPARLLTILRWSDYALVVVAGLAALQFLPEVLTQAAAGELLQAVGFLALAAALGFAAYTGWRHVGVIDPRVWRSYLFVFPLLSVLAVSVVIATLPDLIAEGSAALEDFGGMLSLMAGLYYAGVAVPGFICVLLLRRARIPSTNVKLAAMLENLSARGAGRVYRLSSVPRARLLVGLSWGIAGALVLLAYLMLPGFTGHGRPPQYMRFADQIRVFGFFLLVRARRYFQVSANSLLMSDKRAPVLFLRSFSDDERQRYSSSQRALLDFSLETRLANHFYRFGAFIAVGSPKDNVPQPGAARTLLMSGEWQPRVLGWIKEASLIIMYCGATPWVNWELRRVIESGAATRLILMFPEIRSWRSSRRKKNIEARVTQVRDVFKDTPWNEELMAFDNFPGARAMLFRPDGSMDIVKSRSRSRDAYHLAALVAHYRMLEQPDAVGDAVTNASSLRRRMKNVAIALAAAIALVVGLHRSPAKVDKRLAFKQGELYYSAAVTAEQANGVGEYLVETGFFADDHAVTVKLARQDDVYRLYFVINQAHMNDPFTALELGMIGSAVSRRVLTGAPTEVIFCDPQMTPVKVVARTEKLTFHKGDLYYTAPVTEEEARRTGKVLVDVGFFGDDHEVSVLLSRDEHGNQLKFVIQPERASDPRFVAAISAISRAVAAQALRGQPVAFYLCNDHFEPLGNGVFLAQ